MHTELEARSSLEELAAQRDSAVALYSAGLAKLFEACAAHRSAAPANDSLTYLPDDFRYVLTGGDPARSLRDFAKRQRAAVDRDAWRSVLLSSGIWKYLDAEEHQRMEQSFETDPPEFSPENVRATLARLQLDAGNIFRRGLVRAFERLSRHYKSHDGFKFGARLVVGFVAEVSGTYVTINHSTQPQLRDVDRYMHLLDGKEAPDYQQGLCAAIRKAMAEKTWSVETPYWRVRWFKNGNAHLWALRRDLLDRANLVLAGHFGRVLAGVPGQRNPFAGPPPKQADDLGDFPSPLEVVKRVMFEADIQPGMAVLEPSAGSGNLARFAVAAGARVTCIELQEKHAETLWRERGPDLLRVYQVLRADFLKTTPSPAYDRVVMNPPFANGAAVIHAEYALRFLAPGGRLVAVMPGGWRWRSDRLHSAFRNILDTQGYTWRSHPLPEKSFKASGTMVETDILVVDKKS